MADEGCPVACADDARKHAFWLSTDATGIAIRPAPIPDGRRQPCRKGHFFVVLADRKHIFFEFQAKHTSATVCEMFRGFSGYIQADAHAIYDALFAATLSMMKAKPPPRSPAGATFGGASGKPPSPASPSGARDSCGFASSTSLTKPGTTCRLPRDSKSARPYLRPSSASSSSGSVLKTTRRPKCAASSRRHSALPIDRSALLSRFLDDGGLRMDNNLSENALRTIATGRKAYLFFGSDDTVEAAANIYSLIASCKLHGLDPERYLAEMIRIMPYGPRDRFLELAPAYWAQTRVRLEAAVAHCERH
jgi:transposase